MNERRRISRQTQAVITRIFKRLPYRTLGRVYCYEGGTEFWQTKREPCRRLGLRVAGALARRLRSRGSSLYVGAGVAELPPLVVEALDLRRQVFPCNLRRTEVASLNRACRGTSIRFHARDAVSLSGRFDHLWIVSVLNDPERLPQLSALSYGRADPVTFDPVRFRREKRVAQRIVDLCMRKLSVPGLVTTSSEEVVWIADWCHKEKIPYRVERKAYPTALVGDPICFIRIGPRSMDLKSYT
ncbi:MAG TPA: hypothetical protein VJ746_12350 [Nitrospira sp.]|nr:hypothetical protein [Nitrospira sp.]